MRGKFVLGAGALLIGGLALAVLTPDGASADRLRQRDQLGAQGWVLPGAALDLNFSQGQYFGGKSGCRAVATCLNVVRASAGTAQDSAGNVVSFASGQPRVTNQGLLVEESRTNSQPYNEMAGAAAGSPGAMPTGWSYAQSGGLAFSVAAIGTENGLPYFDLNIAGSAAGSGLFNINFNTNNTAIAASNGQIWTGSWFWRVSAGSTSTLSGCTYYIDIYNSSGSFLSQLGTAISMPIATALGLGRAQGTETLANASTAYVNHFLSCAWTGAQTINVTLRFGPAQLEQGQGATSLIYTNGAAVTRQADFITVANPPAFGQAVTAYVPATPELPATYGTTQTSLQIDEGDNLQRIDLDRGSGSGQLSGGITSNNTAWGAPSAGIWPQNTQWPVAYALQTNDQAMGYAGSLSTYGGTTEMFTPARIVLGSNGNGVHQLDGTIARLAIWPTTRQPNAFLQQITP